MEHLQSKEVPMRGIHQAGLPKPLVNLEICVMTFELTYSQHTAQEAEKQASTSKCSPRGYLNCETRIQEVGRCCPNKSRAKRLLDVFASTSALVILAPFLLAVALAIKLTSSGPILFRQQRYGLGGATFEILKFRTMYHERSDAAGVVQAKANDSRVTPLGAWLRRTNIDELPQLINVLRGEMSLVGPRPHVRGMLAGGVPYEVLVPHYFERCGALPGITGLAQVTGLRGSTRDARLAIDRIECDLAYIRNRSLLLDLRIIFHTLFNECVRSSGC
jgi:lipopolysaccharide/colanic/teichoic acid biosynthesis glycosyltransferase